MQCDPCSHPSQSHFRTHAHTHTQRQHSERGKKVHCMLRIFSRCILSASCSWLQHTLTHPHTHTRGKYDIEYYWNISCEIFYIFPVVNEFAATIRVIFTTATDMSRYENRYRCVSPLAAAGGGGGDRRLPQRISSVQYIPESNLCKIAIDAMQSREQFK